MRKSHLLVAASLLTLALAYWLWPRATNSSDSQNSSASESSEIEKRRAARRDGKVDNTPASVSGRVVALDDNAPLEGAIVSVALRRIDGGLVGQAGQSSAPRATTTDSEGRFRIDNLKPGRYSFSTTMQGYKPQHVEGIRLEGGEERDDINFTLEAGGHLVTGTVTDIGGGPVSFAFVRARKNSDFSVSSIFRAPLTATTNANGEYTLNLDDGSYSFDVFHEDYRTEKRRRVAIGGQDRRVDFVLTPGSMIEGVVLRKSDDQPVPGATVTWVRMGQTGGFAFSGITMNSSAETDSEGKFSLRGLGSGAVEVSAFSKHSSSREPTTVELAIAETVSDVVVYVDEAYMISGFVLNKGSEETAASDVMLGAYNLPPAGALFAADTPSASDGYFEIHGVHPGSYTVGALAEEKLPNLFGEAVTIVDQDVTDVIIKVDGGNSLSGFVNPPQVATITLEVNVEDVGFSTILQAAGSFLVRTRSAADGSFTLKGVGQGEYSLVATAESGAKGKLPVEVKGDLDGLTIAMEERASASGIVVDSAGHPVEGVDVRFSATDGSDQGAMNFRGPNSRQATMTGADGRFKKVGLADGAFEVRVFGGSQLAWANAKGKDKHTAKMVTIENGTSVTGLRFEVEARNHSISGTVLGTDGALLADAWVTARRVGDVDSPPPKDGEDREWRRWSPSETPVLTDADGAFVIPKLRSGLYDITAEGTRNGAKGEVERVKMDTRVNIRIEDLGRLSGQVKQAGNPVKDYIVSVKGPQRRRVHVLRDDGKFNLPRLESGEYGVEITSTEGVASATAQVEPGKEAVVAIQLASFGSVSGILLDAATGEPIADISAVATMDRDQAKFASNAMELITGMGPSTGDEGEFRVGKLGAGEGTIYFMDPEAKGFSIIAQKEFTLEPGEDLDLGEIHGTITERIPRDKKGFIGLAMTVASQCPVEEAADNAAEVSEGEHLWVVSVIENSPAEDAGAEPCDRITSANGMSVSDVGPEALQMLLTRTLEAGDTVTVGVTRKSGDTTLTMEAAPLVEPPEK
jgi:protocatechuate 3,4-dioxygenase beta subunit